MATLTDAKRLVVKIGSALLVDRETGQLKSDWLRSLATSCGSMTTYWPLAYS